jgi:hypothetical protein
MISVPYEEHGVFRTHTIKFSDFEVSYIGEGPERDLLWFGSDDGRLIMTSLDAEIYQGPLQASESRESINGVAANPQHVAVSTRNEVSIFTVHPSGPHKTQRAIVPAGAHEVIASQSGWFVAPLGMRGALLVAPEEGAIQRVKISRARDHDFYFYRVAAVSPLQGPEVLVFANRRGGIASMAVPGQDQPRRLYWTTFPGLDVVDVCPLGGSQAAPAACAVGKDGTVVMFRDVVQDRQPAAVRFDCVRGAAYRVFTARGHVFLLTSAGMYVFYTLASRFLAGERVEEARTAVREFPAEAVDASIVFDRYLLIVMPDEVLRFDLDLLSEERVKDGSHNLEWDCEPAQVVRAWESDESEAILSAVG